MSLQDWWEGLTRRWTESKRFVLATLVFVVAFLAGLVLAFVSSTPLVTPAAEQFIEGVAPEGTSSLPVEFPSASLAEATLSVGPCGLSVHFLRNSEWVVFNESGMLPSPHLNCDILSSGIPDGVTYVVLANERGAASDYRVEFTFYRIESPLALLALPGLLLVMLGSFGIILQVLRRGLSKTVEKILEK